MPLLATYLVLQGQLPPPKPANEKVMAKINGAPITAGDVEPYLWDWRANEVVEDLILLHIAEQAAAKLNLGVDSAELDSRVKKELSQLQTGNYDPEKLKEQGFPMSRIALKIRTALLLEKITLVNFKAEQWAQIGSVEFKPESPSLMTWGKAARQANDFYAKIQKGILWDKLKPQDSAPDRWVPVISLLPEVAEKVKAAAPGTVFPPKQNGQAIEITRLVAWGGRLAPARLEELKSFYVQQNRNATLNRLREEAKVERSL